MSNNIQAAYEATRKFNDIAGNLEDNSVPRVDFQLGLIQEELTETLDALAAKDAIELLDGACDMFVTVAGLMQKLEAAGFSVEEALKRVCDNNLSKFPELEYYYKNYDITPVASTPWENLEHNVVIFKRDADGKVMKPTNFVSVDLEGLAPEGYFA